MEVHKKPSLFLNMRLSKIVTVLGLGAALGIIVGALPISMLIMLFACILLIILQRGCPLQNVRLYVIVWLGTLIVYFIQFRDIPNINVTFVLVVSSVAFVFGNMLLLCVGRAYLQPETCEDAWFWRVTVYVIEAVSIALVAYQTMLAIKGIGIRFTTLISTVTWRRDVTNVEAFSAWTRGPAAYGLFIAFFGFLLTVALRRFGVAISYCHTVINGLLVIISISVGSSLRRNYVYDMLACAMFIWMAPPLTKSDRRKRRLVIVIVGLFMLLSFASTQQLLGKSTGSGWQDIANYVTLNLENASDWLRHEPVFGQRSFHLVAIATEKISGGRFITRDQLDPVNPRLNYYNTLPYFAEWALDIGVLGAVVMSVVLGAMTALVSKRAMKTPLWLVMHGMLQLSILFSFRGVCVSSFLFCFILFLSLIAGVSRKVWIICVRGRRNTVSGKDSRHSRTENSTCSGNEDLWKYPSSEV